MRGEWAGWELPDSNRDPRVSKTNEPSANNVVIARVELRSHVDFIQWTDPDHLRIRPKMA